MTDPYGGVNPWALALMQAGGAALQQARPGGSTQGAFGNALQAFGPTMIASQRLNQQGALAQQLAKQREAQALLEQQQAQRARVAEEEEARMKSSILGGDYSASPMLQAMKERGDWQGIRDTTRTRAGQNPSALDIYMGGDPAKIAQIERFKRLGAPTTSVEVNTGSIESEFNKAQGKGFGGIVTDDYKSAQDAATKGGRRLEQYRQMDALLGEAGGAFEKTKTQFAKMAEGIGIPIGDPAQIGRNEAALSLGNQIAMELRNPAGGAGMPGAMSDADREFLASIPPSIAMTPEGRKYLIALETKIHERNTEVAKIWRDNFRRNGGKVTMDVYDGIAKLGSSNLIDESMKSQLAAVSSNTQPLPDTGDEGKPWLRYQKK